VRLFRCTDPAYREGIERDGLVPRELDGKLYAWPTLEAAEEYRRDDRGNWSDIWSFEDHGDSVESMAMRAEVTARTLDRAVPPEYLALVYGEPFV